MLKPQTMGDVANVTPPIFLRHQPMALGRKSHLLMCITRG